MKKAKLASGDASALVDRGKRIKKKSQFRIEIYFILLDIRDQKSLVPFIGIARQP